MMVLVIVCIVLGVALVGLGHDYSRLCEELDKMEEANKELQCKAHGLE